MRITPSLVRPSFLLAAALALTPAIGATVTWDTSTTAGFQSGNGTWGTDSFWSVDGTTLSPWVSGDTASLLGQTTAVNDTITIGSNQTIGGLAFGSATTSGNWTFSGSGLSLSANSTFTVNAGSTSSIGNTISGAFSLTKAGAGGLTLSGINNYTGTTSVTAGILTVSSGGTLGTGLLNVSGGASVVLNSSSTVSNLAGSGVISIAAGKALTIAPTGGFSFFGGALSGTGALVKSGNGETILQGNGSSGYSGNITFSGGALFLQTTSVADSLGTGDITITGTTTLGTGNAGAISRIANRVFVTAGLANLCGTLGALIYSKDITYSGSSNIKFSQGTAILLGNLTNTGSGTWSVSTGATIQLGNGNTTGSIEGGFAFSQSSGNLAFKRSDNINYTGVLSGTGNLIQAGAGNLTLGGLNTYTGTTTVSAGTLTVGAGGSLGTGNATLSGKLVFNRSDNVNYNGVLSGAGSLTQAGAGNLTLGGLNTYTGTTTVSAGTLTVGSISALGAGIVTVSGAGVVDLGGQAVANSFVVNGGTLQGGTVNIAKITATSGVISSDLSGTTGFTKTGTGTLILGGTNSYTGGTSVNGGTLLVNGTIGAVTVASGGTLGGNGSVGNTSIAFGGTIAAGASVGLLNVANLTLAGGSAVTWQLHDATQLAGVGYDLIMASNLDLSGLSSGSRATLNLMTLANPGDSLSGIPLIFDQTLSQSFTLINYTALNLGANTNVSNLFSINLNGFVAQDGSALSAANFSVINDAASNGLMLQYVSAVPEPSTYGLGLGFLSLAVVAVRRQRRKAAAQA
jgi:fibronectin-binding autotransporter adhesin